MSCQLPLPPAKTNKQTKKLTHKQTGMRQELGVSLHSFCTNAGTWLESRRRYRPCLSSQGDRVVRPPTPTPSQKTQGSKEAWNVYTAGPWYTTALMMIQFILKRGPQENDLSGLRDPHIPKEAPFCKQPWISGRSRNREATPLSEPLTPCAGSPEPRSPSACWSQPGPHQRCATPGTTGCLGRACSVIPNTVGLHPNPLSTGG